MRLLPVVSDGTFRVASRELVLGRHRIPAGVLLWVPFMATFSHPALWNDPDRFVPVRPATYSNTLQEFV